RGKDLLPELQDNLLSHGPRLNVELLGFLGALHDELEARARILTHELVDDAVRQDLIRNLYAQQAPRPRIERRLPQHLRHHLAETLEPRNFDFPAAAGLLENVVLVLVVERPVRVLRDVDAIERWLGQVQLALANELRHVAVDERHQERRDVVAVRVGVREDDDASVPQAVYLEALADAAAERRHEIRQLFVLQHLRGRHAFRVQHLAAQRQDRLTRAIAALLRGPAGRVALDDEQLAVLAAGSRAIAQLAGQRQTRRRRALAHAFRLRRADRLTGPGSQDDARHDRFRNRLVVIQPVLERRPRHRVHDRRDLRVVQPVLRLALELRLLDEDAEDADDALADVVGRERHALRREIVRVDEIADRLADPGAQAVLVRAA